MTGECAALSGPMAACSHPAQPFSDRSVGAHLVAPMRTQPVPHPTPPGRRRAAVAHLIRVMGVSERFACRVTGQNRTTQPRPPTPTPPADPDAALRDWLQAWAKDHPRRGFRNAYHDARAEGWHVNHKKIQRLWREEGLRVPQQRRRKRLGTSTTPNPPKADAPNRVWAVDFQFDAIAGGTARLASKPCRLGSHLRPPVIDAHRHSALFGPTGRRGRESIMA
jgi:hypothetical protein